jgi:hypothetical protein
MSFTLRFEALNALNNTVFGSPDVGVTDTNFGYNPHTQVNNPRIAQVAEGSSSNFATHPTIKAIRD